MATPVSFTFVRLSHLNSVGELLGTENGFLRLQPLSQADNFLLRFLKDTNDDTPEANTHLEIEVFKDSDVSHAGTTGLVVNNEKGTLLVYFDGQENSEKITDLISDYQKTEERVFSQLGFPNTRKFQDRGLPAGFNSGPGPRG